MAIFTLADDIGNPLETRGDRRQSAKPCLEHHQPETFHVIRYRNVRHHQQIRAVIKSLQLLIADRAEQLHPSAQIMLRDQGFDAMAIRSFPGRKVHDIVGQPRHHLRDEPRNAFSRDQPPNGAENQLRIRLRKGKATARLSAVHLETESICSYSKRYDLAL